MHEVHLSDENENLISNPETDVGLDKDEMEKLESIDAKMTLLMMHIQLQSRYSIFCCIVFLFSSIILSIFLTMIYSKLSLLEKLIK